MIAGDKKDRRIETIAAVCHDANRAYCQECGDFSQLPWNDAPEWQRKSARDGVKFHLNNPDAGPSASHDQWKKDKIKAGWKFGYVKDAKKKEHPCMVNYEHLPAEQRLKDYIFGNIIKAFVEAEGGDEGYNTDRKLIVVEDDHKKAALRQAGIYGDCDIIGLGESIVGRSYSKIIVILTAGCDVEQDMIDYYVGQLKKRLNKDGNLIIL